MTTRGRGRPALEWLSADVLSQLPHGTAVNLEMTGGHRTRLVGRVILTMNGCIELDTPEMGEVSVKLVDIRRGRIVSAVYEPGDPVLQRHVPATVWRGGVVRTDGREVLVEQIEPAASCGCPRTTSSLPTPARRPCRRCPADRSRRWSGSGFSYTRAREAPTLLNKGAAKMTTQKGTAPPLTCRNT